ncbi:MAG: hypothetical protein ACJ741_20810 [Pyrinomonadaceae bacterium]
MMKEIIRTICLLVFFTVAAQGAYSCTCERISHRKEFRQTDVIFAGQLVGTTIDSTYMPPKLDIPPIIQEKLDQRKRPILNFKVEKAFKGINAKEVSLITYEDEMPCSGISFVNREGENFLIYADRIDKRLYVGDICSRTQSLKTSSKEYKDLHSSWFRFRTHFPIL